MLQNSQLPIIVDERLPLCVDLDGTLVRTDCLAEALFCLARRDFVSFLISWTWLLRGSNYFRMRVFERANLKPESLPLNDTLIHQLRDLHSSGRKIYLVSHLPLSFTKKIAAHLEIFTDVIGPTENLALTTRNKGATLLNLFGKDGFQYVGNGYDDLPPWNYCQKAFVVSSNRRLIKQVQAMKPCQVLPTPRRTLKHYRKAFRVHQWTKNLLVFVPLFLSHNFLDWQLYQNAVIAILSFCLVSSSVYMINDLLDLESDRAHPENKKRPFASGMLPLGFGVVIAPMLLAGGLTAGSVISNEYLSVLAGYFVLTLAYSLRLKEIALVDTLILAALYSIRILAGSQATDVPISDWLIIFSCSLFFSLALLKRCSELNLLRSNAKTANSRRGYKFEDYDQIVSFGTSSGYLSILVLALYIHNQQSSATYQRPEVLWLFCPIMLYWMSRMWLKAHRGLMHSDPLVFAFKDRASYVIIGISSVVWTFAVGLL
ncbi:MAG: UbiA family prenyltransferase [Oligoflexales bacterium]